MQILLVILAVTVNFEVYAWFNISTNGITTNDFITLIFTLTFLKVAIWDGREFQIAKNPAIPIYFVFLLATVVSGIYPLVSGNGEMIAQYLKTMLHFHFTALITILLITGKYDNSTLNNFIKLWLLLSIFINAFGIYQIIARAFDLPFAWIDLTSASFFSRNQNDVDDFTQLSLRFEGFFRATSFFSEPSALGAFNGLTLAFAIIPGFKKLEPFIKSRILHNTIVVFATAGLMLAFSLTGVAILLIVLFTVFLTEKLNSLFGVIKLIPFLVIFVFLADYAVESYAGISVVELFSKRFGTLSNLIFGGGGFGSGIDGESVTMRGRNFNAMADIWQSSPFIGIGLGLTYYSHLSDGWAFSDSSIMAIMAELGLIGAIPYIALFISFYVISFRAIRTKIIYEKLNDDSKRLMSLVIYIMAYLIVTNFISANNLINISAALFFGFIFAIQNNYYIDERKEFYTLKFIELPLRSRFLRKSPVKV